MSVIKTIIKIEVKMVSLIVSALCRIVNFSYKSFIAVMINNIPISK